MNLVCLLWSERVSVKKSDLRQDTLDRGTQGCSRGWTRFNPHRRVVIGYHGLVGAFREAADQMLSAKAVE